MTPPKVSQWWESYLLRWEIKWMTWLPERIVWQKRKDPKTCQIGWKHEAFQQMYPGTLFPFFLAYSSCWQYYGVRVQIWAGNLFGYAVNAQARFETRPEASSEVIRYFASELDRSPISQWTRWQIVPLRGYEGRLIPARDPGVIDIKVARSQKRSQDSSYSTNQSCHFPTPWLPNIFDDRQSSCRGLWIKVWSRS